MNYFISDLHIRHENMLRFNNQLFSNIEEHDAAILEN